MRLNGSTVGAIANNGEDGELMGKAVLKASKFLSFCDAFNIPVLTLVNAKGFCRTQCSEERMAKEIEEMGADSICIKDMAGLLVPYQATELVKAIKSVTKLPLEMHTHYTSGEASMTYMKAVEAGADILDTAISPFAMGTSQPATEVMIEICK